MIERRIIIAGSRDYIHTDDDMFEILKVLKRFYDFDTCEHIGLGLQLVSGCCPTGPDQIPFILKEEYPNIDVAEFHAQWKENDGWYNHHAGLERNIRMARYADELIALYKYPSSGTDPYE